MAQSGADDKHVNGGLSQCTDGAGGLPSPRSWQRPHGQNSTSSLLASGVIIISTSTSNSAYRYTFLHSVVCLSSVTHSCTLLKPFDALRCHHSRLRTKTMPATVGSKDTFVLDGGPSSEGEIWGSTPQQKMQLQIAASTWQRETRSNSAFSQITLDLFCSGKCLH